MYTCLLGTSLEEEVRLGFVTELLFLFLKLFKSDDLLIYSVSFFLFN